jgi:hypothetical protein
VAAGQIQLWGNGIADRFPDAAGVAAANDDELGLASAVGWVTEAYVVLADRLDRTPVPVPGTPLALNGVILRGVTYQTLLHNNQVSMTTALNCGDAAWSRDVAGYATAIAAD